MCWDIPSIVLAYTKWADFIIYDTNLGSGFKACWKGKTLPFVFIPLIGIWFFPEVSSKTYSLSVFDRIRLSRFNTPQVSLKYPYKINRRLCLCAIIEHSVGFKSYASYVNLKGPMTWFVWQDNNQLWKQCRPKGLWGIAVIET